MLFTSCTVICPTYLSRVFINTPVLREEFTPVAAGNVYFGFTASFYLYKWSSLWLFLAPRPQLFIFQCVSCWASAICVLCFSWRFCTIKAKNYIRAARGFPALRLYLLLRVTWILFFFGKACQRRAPLNTSFVAWCSRSRAGGRCRSLCGHARWRCINRTLSHMMKKSHSERRRQTDGLCI